MTGELGYWPWWLGAAALAGVALLVWWAERKMLGVSGSLAEFIRLVTRQPDLASVDDSALRVALLAATLEEFPDLDPDEAAAAIAAAPSSPAARPRTIHFIFLVGMAAGGAVAVLANQQPWQLSWSFGTTWDTLFAGPIRLPLLLVGGALVGFGTRMAGGCTSGHGLTGCARLEPGSLVATASFFGTAVIVSLFLARLLT